MTKEELLSKRKQLKDKMWNIEQQLKDKSYVSSVDFASMYPSIIRLLNASIENLIGFLDDNPVAYRKLGTSQQLKDYKDKSKTLVKGALKNTDYVKFVGKNEDKVALRKDIYSGYFDDKPVEDRTETPFERYFLAIEGIEDADNMTFTFQQKKYTANEFKQYLVENDYSLSGSGAVYRNPGKNNEHQGLIPSYLEYLFKERKKVKKTMGKHYRNKILLQKFKNAAIADGLYA